MNQTITDRTKIRVTNFLQNILKAISYAITGILILIFSTLLPIPIYWLVSWYLGHIYTWNDFWYTMDFFVGVDIFVLMISVVSSTIVTVVGMILGWTVDEVIKNIDGFFSNIFWPIVVVSSIVSFFVVNRFFVPLIFGISVPWSRWLIPFNTPDMLIRREAWILASMAFENTISFFQYLGTTNLQARILSVLGLLAILDGSINLILRLFRLFNPIFSRKKIDR